MKIAESPTRYTLEPSPPSFDAVILYDDPATGEAAKLVGDLVARELGGERAFLTAFWRVSALADSTFSHSAMEQAVHADILILSLRTRTGLSVRLRAWLHRWTENRCGVAALIVLFSGEPHPAAHAAHSALRAMAQRRGLDFFTQTIDVPAEVGMSPHRELCWML